MAHEPSESQVRSRALSPEKSFIIEAPAGSGKTELLIQRYLRLLARVSQPESIVALTFTRKAATEMKERVLDALRAAKAGELVTTDYAASTRALANAALTQDANEGWNIMEDSSRLQIGTIDSFCSLLTRQMPLLAKIGSAPRVLEFADELYYLAARRTVVALAGNPSWEHVFRSVTLDFDGNLPYLQKLVAAMLAKRDKWIRKLARHQGDDLRDEIDQLLGEDIVCRLRRISELWPATIPNRPRVSADALPEWTAAADILLRASAKSPRKMSRHYDVLSQRPDFCEALHRCRRFVPPPISDSEWTLISNFTIVLRVALAQLDAVFKERGEVDFTRISQAAVEALGPPDRPTELSYQLDFRIEHILVDEFQDTSLSQFELLERLTAQWSPDEGRTLFLVGDPMQSIYQFRDADVSLFIRAAEEGISGIPLERLCLRENFRSTRAIVDWVAAEFQALAPASDDIEIGAICVRPTSAARRERGTVPQIHRFIDDDGSGEASRVVEIVSSSLKKGHSTAILVRARSHLAAILPALRAENIPAEAVDLDALTSEQHILDLLSLTRAIHHLSDSIAWIACLRAPFCGLTLADLATIFENRDGRLVIDVISDNQLIATLPAGSQDRVLRFRNVLSNAIQSFGRFPIRSVVEGAWVALGGPASLESNQRDDAASFFGLLESCDSGGRIPDFALFEDRLEYLFARPSNSSGDRVQVMTIHKAKGLQFDTVIIPHLERSSGQSESDLLVWSTPLGEVRSLVAGLPPTGGDGFSDPPYYRLVRDQSRRKEEAEQARLLYVAVTRAREELHLLGNVETKKAGLAEPTGFLKLLWPREKAHFEAELIRHLSQRPAQQALSLTPENVTILRRLRASWRLPVAQPGIRWTPRYEIDAPSEHKPSFDWVSETGRHVGSIVHAMLRRIAEEGLEAWHPARISEQAEFASRELESAGVPSDERSEAIAKVLGALRNATSSERGRWILSSHSGAYCEWPIAGTLDGGLITARIDRTFVDVSGTRWIIDYKTSTHEGAAREKFLCDERARYEPQLTSYARLLQAAGDRDVAVGLYFPLLDEWLSWSVEAQEEPATAHS